MLRPLGRGDWNFTTAAHLLNRAGFGGPPTEIERLESMGLEGAVSHLVDFEKIPDDTADPTWARPDPDRAERFQSARNAGEEERRRILREEQQRQRQRMLELREWWMRRMAEGPRPLQEKMVLFWHGHFATSVEKVREAYLMWRQNDLFRRQATGQWRELLIEVARDPAMLVWLDQAQSRREHPNENFAREVMELFALGEGHYTEKDIAEGARALTGWGYDRLRQRFMQRPFQHDDGLKTIFGRTGRFDGADFIGLIAEQPQAPRFISAKIWKFFAGGEPSPELTEALAGVFREGGDQFKPLLRAIFTCEAFYSPAVIRNQVKSPVQWLISSARMLERELPPPMICFGLTRNLGQDLFAPPNVKGWDGGLSWITTNNLLARYNEAAILVEGDVSSLSGAMFAANPAINREVERRMRNARVGRVDVKKLFTEQEKGDQELLVQALQKRLLQGQLKAKQEKVLRDFLEARKKPSDEDILAAIRLVMSTPEFQLT